MKKTKPKYIGTIAFLIAVVVCLFFTAHAGALVTEYARTINEQAAKRAMFYADEVALGVRETCDDFRREVDFVAEKLSECVSERETAEELKKLYLSGIASDTFLTVFYLKDGEFTSLYLLVNVKAGPSAGSRVTVRCPAPSSVTVKETVRVIEGSLETPGALPLSAIV